MRLLALLLTLVSQPFVGIVYFDRTEESPRAVHMHVLQIDLAAPGLRFKLSPPAGARETVRQTTLEYLRQEHAQAAVNAHFFLPFPSKDATMAMEDPATHEATLVNAYAFFVSLFM